MVVPLTTLGRCRVGRSGTKYSFVLLRLELPVSINQAPGEQPRINLEISSHEQKDSISDHGKK